jgi:hypothetical protein
MGDDDIDAHVGSGSGSGSGGNLVDNVTCQTHNFTVVQANGSKIVTDTRVAFLANIDPTLAVVETCGRKITSNGIVTVEFGDPACPTGANCSSSGVPFPTGTPCTFTAGGMVVGGNFVVSCGYDQHIYDTNGNPTSSFTLTYESVRVHH